MKIYQEQNIYNFNYWGGAVSHVGEFNGAEWGILEEAFEDMFPEGIDETELNDLFWFEEDWIAEILGYEDWEDYLNSKEN